MSRIGITHRNSSTPAAVGCDSLTRPLSVFPIRSLRHLAFLVGSSKAELAAIVASLDQYYIEQVIVTRGKARQLRVPLGRLKQIQKSIQRLLRTVPLPDEMHGCVRQRSVFTNARQHVGQRGVLTVDIADCFGSVRNRRVYSVFSKELGCTPDVARLLTLLTTYRGCLPQGAPSSPAVANLTLVRSVRRIAKLSQIHNVRFTIYVDDISLSGEPGTLDRILPTVSAILRDDGFRLRREKTVLMIAPQPQVITGVTVNLQLDFSRTRYRELARRVHSIGGTHDSASPPPGKRELASLEGSLSNLACLNPGAARQLRRRIARGLHTRDAQPLTGGRLILR